MASKKEKKGATDVFKTVTDETKLGPGVEIKVGPHRGRVITISEHPRHGTVVNYRDLYSGAQKLALLADVKIETQKRNVRGDKHAKSI